MGRASKWFRSLLRSRKSLPDNSPAPPPQQLKEKKKGKWVLPKFADGSNFRNEDPLASPYIEGIDGNRHAIAVAAATAAVAEAALAAAHAAAEVVRLTSGVGGGGSGSGRNVAAYISSERRRVSAAIKIQSGFRAYLARRALRALKGLVKLQALVRGRIVRKQSADMLRRMQAMARIQARASAQRSQYPTLNSSISGHPAVANPRKYDPLMSNSMHKTQQSCNPRSSHLNSHWLDNWMEQSDSNNCHGACRVDDERSDKILEMDTCKPSQHTRRKDRTLHHPRVYQGQDYSKSSSLSRLSAKNHKPNPSISSEEASSSIISPNFPLEGDHGAVWNAESSPRVHSASSARQTYHWRGPLTTARSECSRSVFADYLSHPNYMANTESSRAKVRSQSAPRQRLQLETFGRGLWENDCCSEKGFAVTTKYDNPYFNSAYLKKQGSPGHGAAHNGIGSVYGFRM